ncbi:PBSX family phage terminase large subunit, partial [Inquilinus limosus]|uniref:PBSX family phage terminase large subunit n=1 Tax=Inquilinus limosus TaxID=171674 RepID=UPI003F15E54C
MADTIQLPQRWDNFAWCYVHHGNAARAAREAGYATRSAAQLGFVLLTKPQVVTACFGYVARLRAEGQPPSPHVVQRLGDIAKARRLPGGVAERDLGHLPPMLAAFRQFCRDQGLDETGMVPAPQDPPAPPEEPAPWAAGPPLPALPPPDLVPAFQQLLEPSRYKAVHGGRGSGKSHVFAELLVRRCLDVPTRAVCIREVQRSLDQSVKRLLEDKIQALGAGAAFRVQADRILTPGGGRIIFQGMQNHTAESIKSLEGYDIAWVEEAQSLSKRSLELLRPTLRKPGSELWFSWNPTRPDDPVDQLFRGGPAPPDTVLIEANWSANPHFPKVLQAEMAWDRERDPDKYQHVWLGGYRRVSEARVFRNWRVEAFETPADARFLFGADWGFARDPTVLVRCFLKGRTLHVDHEAYRVGCEIDRTPALFDTVPEARRWPIVADGARPETISFMQRHGFPRLRAAAKGGGSVKEGVEFLKSCDILVHPRCRHLIDELALFSWRTDP